MVRQVTNVHANWSEQERGGPGKFSYQLILDNGAEEYAIRPEAEDADVLIELFKLTELRNDEGPRPGPFVLPADKLGPFVEAPAVEAPAVRLGVPTAAFINIE